MNTTTSDDQTTPASSELERLENIFSKLKAAYAQSPMPSLRQRIQDLNTLKVLLIQHQHAIAAAINADFTARSATETMLADILPSIQSINHTLKHLKQWMKPSKRHVGIQFLPASAQVVYQPLGVVGIIVPFNYPVGLAIVPLMTALAAGNRAMIKMSEFTPRTSALLADMLRKVFRESQVAVITGGVDISAAFSRLPFDHLLFTGSTTVGKQVMRAAAENLMPVTLELGGKSPAIIADDIPLQDIVEQLCFAKSLNAGQTCVAPDYVLIPRGKVELFIQLYKTTFRKMYPAINGNPDYTSLLNEQTYKRLQAWLKDAEDKGASIEKCSEESITDGTFRMSLHLVTDVTEEMQIMQHELFGPILPIIPYNKIEDAIAFVNLHPRPLSLYLFSYDRALQEQIVTGTHSGSICINDAMIQFGVDDLPFGGIGPSGMGQYHGREGFLTMTKAKAIMRKGRVNSMKFIYPPYGGIVQKWLVKWLTR
jgi:coniferyl-aldehyde dehydrogenase